MARKAISPWFIFRRVAASAQDGGAEQDLEIDFQIGQGQAVEIAHSELGVAQLVLTSTGAALQNTSLMMSLHRRTGTLTDEVTPAPDSSYSQSEVLQGLFLTWGGNDPGAAGCSFGYSDQGQRQIDWRSLLGEPLLVAANLTLRITIGTAISGAATWNGMYTKLLYRYVTATPQDLVKAFIARQ